MKSKIAIIVLGVALVGMCINVSMLRTRCDALEVRLRSTQTELVAARADLSRLQDSLGLCEFESAEQLEQWTKNWMWGEMYGLTGVWDFGFRNLLELIAAQKLKYTCVDIAERFVRDARNDGYLVSECLVDSNRMVYGIEVGAVSGNHVGILARADGHYYYVEPQFGTVTYLVQTHD